MTENFYHTRNELTIRVIDFYRAKKSSSLAPELDSIFLKLLCECEKTDLAKMLAVAIERLAERRFENESLAKTSTMK